MDTLYLLFDTYNTKLISYLDQEKSFGLANGKMGFCLYFFMIDRLNKNKKYKKKAEDLLDNIFQNISKINSINVNDGLAGIGLGLHYLIKEKYIKGNINIVLEDIDDLIFKHLSYSKYSDTIPLPSKIQILYYLYIRIKEQKAQSESYHLLEELIILTVNDIYEKIDLQFFEEESRYCIDYQLPILLIVISKIYSLNFYNYRILKILEELTPKILSITPVSHSQCLYLLCGLVCINQQIEIRGWIEHIRLLTHKIDFQVILNEEMREKNIFFHNGIISIYMLLVYLEKNNFINEVNEYKETILKSIRSATIWDTLLERKNEFSHLSHGLFNGFCGVFLFFNIVTKIPNEL